MNAHMNSFIASKYQGLKNKTNHSKSLYEIVVKICSKYNGKSSPVREGFFFFFIHSNIRPDIRLQENGRCIY
jgi:hypothetical protein